MNMAKFIYVLVLIFSIFVSKAITCEGTVMELEQRIENIDRAIRTGVKRQEAHRRNPIIPVSLLKDRQKLLSVAKIKKEIEQIDNKIENISRRLTVKRMADLIPESIRPFLLQRKELEASLE